MTTSRRFPWQRDWAVAPGEVLSEALEERGMSQSELARRMARPTKTINEIVNGKAAITADTAVQLELALGITAGFWNGLEASYRTQLARQRTLEQLAVHASWADAFPLADLHRHGLVTEGASKGATVASLLRFFGVSAPSAWEREWLHPAASFRRSPAFEASPHAVAAWLRWGELRAQQIQLAPFDRARLRAVLDEIRPLTRRPVPSTLGRVRDLLASAGVALVLTPEFKGTHLSGAARWLSAHKALIQLSLRHKSNDHFWFSLFHEAGHLLSGKRANFVDTDAPTFSEADEEEQRADTEARDLLLPPGAFRHFVASGDFSLEAVRAYAQQQNVAPAIVVGRLQRDRHIPPSRLNELKRRIDWAGFV